MRNTIGKLFVAATLLASSAAFLSHQIAPATAQEQADSVADKRGKRGKPGPQGPKGEPGDPRLFAVINADGTLARGNGVTSNQATGVGTYEVIFNREIATTCSWVATIGGPGTATPATGFIRTALRSGTTNGVFINTEDTAAANSNRAFHLQLSCLPTP